MALLEVDDLRTFFKTRAGEVHAVDGVSFSVERGKTLGIVGESGCGKSVTALSIMGLLPPSGRTVSGSIRFEGRELTTMSQRELEDVRGRQIAMIFQDPMTSLNPTLTIGLQIMETMQRHLDFSRDEARKRAIELLEEVHIPNARQRLDDYPHRYSGGMRQRVMIAIALSCKPRLLIADEPTTALDVTIQAQILDLMKDLKSKVGAAIVLITHDLGIVAEVAERVMVMYAGRKVEEAPVAQLFRSPRHPYTQGLFGAVPKLGSSLDGEQTKLAEIPGVVPSLKQRIAGCVFA